MNKNKEIQLLVQHCQDLQKNHDIIINNLEYQLLEKDIELKQLKDEIIDLHFDIYNKNKEINNLQNLLDDIKNFISTIQDDNSYIQLFNPNKILDNLMIIFYNHLCGTNSKQNRS